MMKVSDPISDKLRDIKIQIKKQEKTYTQRLKYQAMNEMRQSKNREKERRQKRISVKIFTYFNRIYIYQTMSKSIRLCCAQMLPKYCHQIKSHPTKTTADTLNHSLEKEISILSHLGFVVGAAACVLYTLFAPLLHYVETNWR